MGSEVKVSPPLEIVNIADDDDDDVSLLYAVVPPPPVYRNLGTSTTDAISVEQYSHDRDIRLATIASLFPPRASASSSSTSRTRRIIDLSRDYPDDDDDDDVQVLDSFRPPPPPLPRNRNRNRNRKPFRGGVGPNSISERGQCSNFSKPFETTTIPTTTTLFMCEICVEPKPYTDSFRITGCTHSYCSDCMIKYVASKLQDNINQIRCPVSDCKGLLQPEDCRSILPPEVFDRWGNALCEAVILASEKFYCPFKDCSTLLIDDRGGGGGGGGEVITQSECPHCRRLFCVQCKVPWHSGIACADFQKLNKDEREREDILLMQLAKNNNWIRCPRCRFYVEKSQGCLFMRCRCGNTFCYNCGTPLISHYCSNCKH